MSGSAPKITPLTQVASGALGRTPASHETVDGVRAGAAVSSWSGIADYPTPIVNNAVAYDPLTRQVFSVGGQNDAAGGAPGQAEGVCPAYGQTANAYVYQPSAKMWNPIAPLPQPLESPSAAFVNGTLYVVGGFDCNQKPSAAVYAYNPGGKHWTQVASLPTAVAAPGIAVLNGQLYIVGGCESSGLCGSYSNPHSQLVYRYDPSRGTWAKLANYPVYGGVSFGACAGIDGEIACAGGLGTAAGNNNVLNFTYLYNPASNTWTQGADMPYASYQMASSGSGGKLQIAGGVDGAGDVTGQAAQYNPVSNTWTALPSLPAPEWGGGGACGMYVIGGFGDTTSAGGTATSQVLPGYAKCDGAQNTGWLPAPRGFTLQPGQSATVTVTLDASKVNQPGTYTANLWAATNTPYPNTVIPVTLYVNPPKGWGLLSGKVTASGGKPIPGATVQVGTTCTAADYCGKKSYTLTAGADGTYQWWLPTSDNRLLVIAAKGGYVQRVTHTSIVAGETHTLNYRLQGYRPLQR